MASRYSTAASPESSADTGEGSVKARMAITHSTASIAKPRMRRPAIARTAAHTETGNPPAVASTMTSPKAPANIARVFTAVVLVGDGVASGASHD
ncbi:Uncharacterised protein [Mycobacteroides abscessus subsp. abscessus]|nr:Uncharacterised protein [Mycobacteroides abscessus subsp. abscessus]